MNLKVYSSQDFPTYLPKLSQLYDDLFSGGKGFRAKLIQMVGESLELPQRDLLLLAQTIEFIHNASLLHDDLVDRSQLRRGKTTAWLRYTPEYAVLAGDYLLARVMVNLSQRGNIQLVQYTALMISDLLEGEWLQDSLVGDPDVSLSQLDRVHNLKTASLFKWCLRAPFILREDPREKAHELLDELGTLLGVLFQRSDDLLDFDVRNFEGKAFLGDLKSGYFNSFASFLCADLSPEIRRQVAQVKDLEQLKDQLGREFFSNRVEEFDRMNESLIHLYDHHLDSLEEMLNESEKDLLKQLRPLNQILYWRKKD